VQELAGRFVPVADEVWQLQNRKDATGELFRELAEQGHYAGRTKPTNTRQGIYAAAPSGRLLASINTRSARQMEGMLRQALDRWEAMGEDERYGGTDPRSLAGSHWAERYPTDGLVLRVYSRDLPRDDLPDDWRARAWNQDFAWFTREEMRAFLPEEPEVGASRDVSRALVERLARCHLVDNVRGQVLLFKPEHVERAALHAEVVEIDDESIRVLFTGSTRTEQRGVWRVNGHRDEPREQTRGFDAELLGRATWDRRDERFTEFDLLAIGERWGGTQYNGRADDLAPSPMGVLLTLAETEVRVPPASIWAYGW